MTCFFTCRDERAKDMAKGMVKSVKRFYPEIPFIVCEFPTESSFNLQSFCSFCLSEGKRLLEEYDRIIYIDPDSIMCAPCPDLFEDFELGVVANNIPVASAHGGIDGTLYVNNGVSVCASKEAWQAYTDEYNKRCSNGFEALHHQNSLNYLVHTLKFKTKLLEFDDRVYGISCNQFYKDMFLNNDLYVPVVRADQTYNKKLCLFHAAGPEWKNNGTSINFEAIADLNAREHLRSFTL